jgi:hypothetical protein
MITSSVNLEYLGATAPEVGSGGVFDVLDQDRYAVKEMLEGEIFDVGEFIRYFLPGQSGG